MISMEPFTTESAFTEWPDNATYDDGDDRILYEDPNFFILHPVLTIVYLTVLSTFMMIGNIGNLMVIGAVVVDKRLRTKGNVFIVNLAIADLFVTGFVDPMSIAGVVLGPRYFMERMGLCHVIGSLCLASCVCSLWTISTISLNRYILICQNHAYSNIFTWNRCILYCILLWFFAALLDIPNYVNWGDHSYDMKTMACSYDRTASYSYTAFFIAVFVIFPLTTVSFCNLHIFMKVRRSKLRVGQHKPVKSTTGSTIPELKANETSFRVDEDGTSITQDGDGKVEQTRAPKVRQSDMKLWKTLFIVFLVFLVCWTPYAGLCLIDVYDQVPKEYYVVAIKMAHMNSSLNSLLYAALNKNFMDGYKLLFKTVFSCRVKSF